MNSTSRVILTKYILKDADRVEVLDCDYSTDQGKWPEDLELRGG